MNQTQVPVRPNNNLVWAILTTIFCCLPTGIVAIVHASKVNTLYDQGDYEEAYHKAKQAKDWAIGSAVAGIVGSIVCIVFSLLFGIGMAAMNDSDETDSEDVDLAELALSGAKNEARQARQQIREGLETANAECPIEVSDEITLTSIKLQGDYIVSVYEVDEELIDINELCENSESAKERMIEQMKVQNSEDYELYQKAEVGCVWKYVGDETGTTCTITAESYELLP